MAQCNIDGALKLIEDLYNRIDSKDDAKTYEKKALKDIFDTVNNQRALLQEAGSFAGSSATLPLARNKPKTTKKSPVETIVTPVVEQNTSQFEDYEVTDTSSLIDPNGSALKVLKELFTLNKKVALDLYNTSTSFVTSSLKPRGGNFNKSTNTLTLFGLNRNNETTAHELIHSLQGAMTVSQLSKSSKEFLVTTANQFLSYELGIDESTYKKVFQKILDKDVEKLNRVTLEKVYLTSILKGDYKPEDSTEQNMERFGREFTAIIGSSGSFRESLYGNIPAERKTPFKMYLDDVIKVIKNVKMLIGRIIQEDSNELLQSDEYVSALKLLDEYLVAAQPRADVKQTPKKASPTYEVSTQGDKRFSALVAKLGDGRTIEQAWAEAKGYPNIKAAKGKLAKNPNFNYWSTYLGLWQQWAKENPELIRELKKIVDGGAVLTDKFAKTENNQATALSQIIKDFKEEKPSIPSPSSEVKAYKVTGNMTTNEGQTKAINEMIAWFKSNTSNTFMLQGRGGTGKTTVINVLLRELGISSDDVTFAAPTNKAKKVIAEANKATVYGNSGYYTIAQLLAIKPEIDENGFEIFKEDLYTNKPNLGSVLIVDEGSMLHSMNYETLIARAKETGTKIIFMGDNAQLPPIKDKNALITSVVFSENQNSTTALTQLMRQDEDSPIINFTDKLIRIVNKVENYLLAGGSFEQAKSGLKQVLFDSETLSKFNEKTNEGLVLTDSTFVELLPNFLKDYKKNPKGTKYITFNNHVHQYTLDITNKVRKSLYGDKANEEMFIKGEPLMLHKPYRYDIDADGFSSLDNGEEFTVVSSVVKKKQINYKVGQKSITTAEKLEVYEIVATDSVTGAEYTFNKPVGTEKEVLAFINNEKQNTVANGSRPGGAFMLKEVLAEGLSHGYVINTHKSQGSSYENVYMDLGNIAGQQYSDANSTIKSLYVAASRPRKKLVVIDSRPSTQGNQLVNPISASEFETLSPEFENINEGEANDIIKEVDNCKFKGE
jgi:exodeoxyribonuclease-5